MSNFTQKALLQTFEDMLEAAKGKVILFTELKGATADRQMVDDAVALIRRYGMEEECVLISLKYDVIDYAEDKILASINGENPEWCDMTEEYMEVTGDTELGFTLGSFFIPLFEVMRFYS